MLAIASICTINAQEVTREGKNFTQVQTVKQSSDKKTEYTYTIKDKTYPVYITKNGRCYVIRTSKNGNDYKQYLDEQVARQICKELGVEYKESK